MRIIAKYNIKRVALVMIDIRKYIVAIKTKGVSEKVKILTAANIRSNILIPGRYTSNISFVFAPKFHRRRCDKNTEMLVGTIV